MTDSPEPSEWVDRYGDALFSFAFFKTNNRDEAEEAVQETLFRGIQGLDSFRGQSSLKTWLTAILKNVLRETDRRKTRAIKDAEQLDAYEPELSITALQALPPNVAVERAEFWEVVEGCLELLPVKTAKIFWEREVERKSVREVAAEIGVSDNVVTVSLHRARKFVRNCVTRTMNFVGLGHRK